MVNGKWLPILQSAGKRQHDSVSFVYRSYHLPMPDPESINADSLNSNFLQLGRRSGGRPQRAVYLHAVTCQHCDTHYFSKPRTRNLPIVSPTRYQ